MSHGITNYGAYVPRLRLDRSAIAAAHAWMAPSLKGMAKGARAFCSWDEDAVTMAVEAARDCVAAPDRGSLRSLRLISTTAPYADLESSAIIAAALDLDHTLSVADGGGSQRAAVAALAAMLAAPADDTLLVASDRPRAKPASTQEMAYGAGAAALRIGSSDAIARRTGHASVTRLFVDHFRPADEPFDYFWEERWIRDEGYAKIIPEAVAAALTNAGLGAADIDWFIFASPIRGAAAGVAKQLGLAERLADTLDEVGYAGVAHPLLMLANVLDKAEPGQRILVVGFGQGADALVLETTDAIADVKRRDRVAARLADRLVVSDYLRMATHYGVIEPEWGMRGERSGKAALTQQYRSADQILPMIAGKCGSCETVQFPQLAYCVNPQCNAPAGGFTPFALTEDPVRVLTFTADLLSYYPAPPLYIGFAQFACGARLIMEMVDLAPGQIEIGLPMKAVFRIKERDRERGYNRYFWKLAPAV